MAVDPSAIYGAQVDTSDPAGYPLGQPRNVTSPGDGTGTPLERRWLADIWGLLQSLLDESEQTVSGTPDKVGASQYLEALDRLFAPTLIEVTATGSVDITPYPWAQWAFCEVVGGGAGGLLGGGGTGFKESGWLPLAGETVIACTVGVSAAAGAPGNFSRARVGSSTVLAVLALGAPAATGNDGGDGYTGGGGAGGAGGVLGSNGATSVGTGGTGRHGTVGGGSGIENAATAGAAGSLSPGGGGGGAGHWPGANASNGSPGTGSAGEFGAGGQGGQGVGAGGGGGGGLGTAGANGAGGASARGGIRIWLYRNRTP